MTELKWTGDLESGGCLGVADLQAICCRHADGVWSTDVMRVDGVRITDVMFDGLHRTGGATDGDTARAICEAIIKEAIRADEAEAKIHDLRHERNERQAAWQQAEARADGLEAKLRAVPQTIADDVAEARAGREG